jgi:hypothetical protein
MPPRAVLVQIEEGDLRGFDRPVAVIEEPPSADPDVEVTRAGVGVVAVEHPRAATSPDEAVREPEYQEVVAPQHKRRVDTLPGVDLIG